MEYINQKTGEKCCIAINFLNPTEEHATAVAAAFAVATFSEDADAHAVLARKFVSDVNAEIKAHAVATVLAKPDIITACAEATTFGGFMWKEAEGLSYTSTFYKTVSVPNGGKYMKEERPVYVTYLDCVKYLKKLNAYRKEQGAAPLSMNGALTVSENRFFRYFAFTAEGRFTAAHKAEAEAHGTDYAAFYEGGKKAADAAKARVNAVYGVINRRCGMEITAIPAIEGNLKYACINHNSMMNNTRYSPLEVWISNVICEWISSRDKKAQAGKFRVK